MPLLDTSGWIQPGAGVNAFSLLILIPGNMFFHGNMPNPVLVRVPCLSLWLAPICLKLLLSLFVKLQRGALGFSARVPTPKVLRQPEHLYPFTRWKLSSEEKDCGLCGADKCWGFGKMNFQALSLTSKCQPSSVLCERACFHSLLVRKGSLTLSCFSFQSHKWIETMVISVVEFHLY